MRLKNIITGHQGLSRADIMAAVSFACNLTTEEIYSNMDRQLTGDDLAMITKCLYERLSGKPLAYITGKREFFSEDFTVDGHVLIPRPETETLVEEAIKLIGNRKDAFILDVGTGSGAIGIILAKYTGNRTLCTDISYSALRIAAHNARSIGVDRLVHFLCADLLDSLKAAARFDLIAANLPYVANEEWDDLMIDVKQFEPRLALDGGKNGMEVYRRLIPQLQQYLAEGGHILLEIGSARQADEICTMFEKMRWQSRVLYDYSGRERVIAGHG